MRRLWKQALKDYNNVTEATIEWQRSLLSPSNPAKSGCVAPVPPATVEEEDEDIDKGGGGSGGGGVGGVGDGSILLGHASSSIDGIPASITEQSITVSCPDHLVLSDLPIAKGDSHQGSRLQSSALAR